VWSWPPDAEAKSAVMLRITPVTVANKPGTPGRSRISRKTIAQGRPGDLGTTCGDYPVLLSLHRGRGCGQHPAFPAPSYFSEGGSHNNSGAFAPRECGFMSAFLSWPLFRDACYASSSEVFTRGAKSDPHGEEAHRAVSNQEAR